MDSASRLWRRFEKTGQLADYLSFCEERRRCEPSPAPDGNTEENLQEDQSSL